ncbi:MAG TPA: SRPBCC family protein [Nocardioides sp.]|nr:SRPBCC family protein [Nocardioides sp.]
MKLHHSTRVEAKPDEVWEFLQDTRSVVACLPGAELTDELGDDKYAGALLVGIGPLRLNYNGQVDVTRRDAGSRTLELAASGRDRRGSGSVRADVRVEVTADGDASRLEATTDLNLTGRIAALGRGVQDVSQQMFQDFAGQLAVHVAGPEPVAEPVGRSAGRAGEEPAPTATATVQPPVRPAPAPTGAPNEIKLTRLVVNVTRQRLADLFQRWSERLRP